MQLLRYLTLASLLPLLAFSAPVAMPEANIDLHVERAIEKPASPAGNVNTSN